MAVADSFYGFNFPFLGETFVLPAQAGVRLIKNDLKQLLLTGPRERVMRSDFGTPIRETPFELGDETTEEGLKTAIREAVTRYEPRVFVRDVIVNGDDKHLLEITVMASLTQDPNVQFSIDLELVNPRTSVTSTQNPVQ